MPQKYPDKNKKGNDPFQDMMISMNDFFNNRPMKGFLQSIDEFFKAPAPFGFSSFPVHVEETETEHIITAELPGIKREQLEIEMFDHYVSISIKNSEVETKEDSKQQYYRRKSSYHRSSRTVSLPHPIDPDRVKARYENGLLTVVVPAQKGKRIKIEGD
ncbi:heat shock protein Hsp20 [Bacillus oleivorans]|uniref:Heat shock protein Hsp20 n=1 Tax=Bacillus oleivorans TaxID=1448271 RepID=A0A285CKV5_9BACI|nr:Hsp20/alpha crystallin family protein [Bacillus oleivorans]SNX68187.1 heat shock protein Hsp20 [Bacillus oleivorans]